MKVGKNSIVDVNFHLYVHYSLLSDVYTIHCDLINPILESWYVWWDEELAFLLDFIDKRIISIMLKYESQSNWIFIAMHCVWSYSIIDYLQDGFEHDFITIDTQKHRCILEQSVHFMCHSNALEKVSQPVILLNGYLFREKSHFV